jgi:hypothetical protein
VVAGSDRCHAHRRPEVSPELVQQLVAMLRAGNYLEVAAQAAGVELGELLGRPELCDQVGAARAEGEVRGITQIARAATENWQAAAWLLERQYPERWGRPAQRPGEESAPPLVLTDGLDELAGRRAARRAAP